MPIVALAAHLANRAPLRPCSRPVAPQSWYSPGRLEGRVAAVLLAAVVPVEQRAGDEEADERACVRGASC